MPSARDGAFADYFELFSLPARYGVDLQDLERRYKLLMGEIHPDRFQGDSERAKRLAVQYSGLVNEAYDTLRDPLKRGSYMVGKHGFDPFDELNTEMPGDFLMSQLELREAIDEAGDDTAKLKERRDEVAEQLARYREQVGRLLDDSGQWAEASQKLREMSYFTKALAQLERKIGAAGR